MRRLAALPIALSLLLCACASSPAGTSDLRRDPRDPAVMRGQALSERRCAGCHVVGLDDRDGAAAPRFRDLSQRYNALSLQRRFEEIAQHGSGEMPPIQITRSEAEDLIAYFESLEPR